MFSHILKKGGAGGGSDSSSITVKSVWSSPATWHFDIDKYLNHIIPAPRWRLVPYPIAHFLGHRKRERVRRIGNIAMTFWAFVGIFVCILFIELALKSLTIVEESGLIIVASFGAAAVLEFYTIESPLAQPRNAVLGQIISVTIGMCICKLFALSPHFESIRWVGGALACATATAVMALTKNVHPPAGATALLAVVDRTAAGLGWHLIYVVLLGCAIMLGTALLVNNIQSRFPSYWWTPEDLRRKMPDNVLEKPDAERQSETGSEEEESGADMPEIVLRRGEVIIRGDVTLDDEEKLFLETISGRL
ncbi:HPP family protein [Coniochaeta hoffmannii]|uniref:HPP family protein n=1 Tax=Coniochaeta hoffmannii TaxID=91930 RepID=A0AA38RJ77_9PEZI|nr:HPP family protein [Coniochaeta hoffmannii]